MRGKDAAFTVAAEMNRFIDEKKDNWERLEDLLGLLAGSRLSGLTKMEVREFGELYRRAAADLAIARGETRDPKLINYLNSLVIRAHGKIYRAEGKGVNLIAKFFARDLPRTFRANSRYMLLAFAIYFGFAIFGFIATWINSEFTHFVMLSGVTEQIRAGDQWWLSLNNANQLGASFILTNNILVTLRVFALGALFGVGAVYTLAFEGARLGSVFGACYSIDPSFGNALATFVVGHGVIELSCIFFCAGAGMMIGYALIDPGDLSRGQALKKKGIEAVQIVAGCAVLLVIAGIIEGFISPSGLPPAAKITTGVLSGAAMYAYFFFVGRSEPEPSEAG